MSIPGTWKLVKSGPLYDVYSDIVKVLMDKKYIDYKPVLYTFKSSTTWGWQRQGSCCGVSVVGLNEVFLKEPQKATRTIIHELAHCVYPRDHHSTRWSMRADAMYRAYDPANYRHMSCKDNENIIGVKLPAAMSHRKDHMNKVWALYCPHCKKILRSYQTRCQKIIRASDYRHTKCKTYCKSGKIDQLVKDGLVVISE